MAIETITTEQLEEKVSLAPRPVALDFYQATSRPAGRWSHALRASRRGTPAGSRSTRIDIDRDFDLAARYGIDSLPTVVVLLGGKEVSRLAGLIVERDLEAASDQAIGSRPAR